MFKVFVALSSLFAAASAAVVTRQDDPFSGTHSGDGTWYYTGLGACGVFNVDSDFIAAASYKLFDIYPGATPNPNLNPICGRTVTATNGINTITVAITDRCAGCEGEFDLDFSPAAFSALADQSLGRIPITWTWN